MIPYASRTGTRRNLAVLRDAGWRLIVSAKGSHRSEGFQYGLDNGAWWAYQQKQPFDVAAFEKLVDKMGKGADWIVAPDIVGGGLESLRVSEQWLPMLVLIAPVLLAVQDGMTARDVEGLLGARVGIFVGGTTEWKLDTLQSWGEVARKRGCYLHVGRVNTARRIQYCHDAGADSFDGSSVTRFAKSLPRLDNATKQRQIFDLVDAAPECRDCGSSELYLDPTDGETSCVNCGETQRAGIYDRDQ